MWGYIGGRLYLEFKVTRGEAQRLDTVRDDLGVAVPARESLFCSELRHLAFAAELESWYLAKERVEPMLFGGRAVGGRHGG